MEKIKENKKKIAILIIISVIISILLDIIMVNKIKKYSDLSIARIVTMIGLIVYLGLHFIIGFRSLYGIIVENRYKISGIMIIISTILGFFMNSLEIKEWIFTTDKVLSLWWNIKFFVLLLASYELFLIITNKNQNLSIVGTTVLAFSGVVQLNFTKIDSLILGEIIIVLIYKIITNESIKKNILMSVAIIICSISYMYTFRPYAVAFGYVFLALIIWIIIRNRNVLKNNKINLTSVIIVMTTAILGALIANIFFYKYNSETVEEFSYGISGLFSYLYNCLLPFYNFEQKEMFGSIISVFPIPMCISLYYMYKNDKHADFLLPITVVTVFETIFCISGFPEILSKITMFSDINSLRVMPAVGLSNLLIIFYFLENVDEEILKVKYTIRMTIILICFLMFLVYPTTFSAKKFLYLFASELSLLSFSFLNYNDKKIKKIFLFFLVSITLICGVPVNFFI